MLHKASCQCGGLAVETEAEPDFVVACNCKACQLRTGAVYGVGAYFPKSVLEISGESHTFDRLAETGRALTNHFCPVCGTNVFWSLEMRPDYLGVAYGCFETSLPEPVRAIWTSKKHDWVRFPEDWPQFETGSPS